MSTCPHCQQPFKLAPNVRQQFFYPFRRLTTSHNLPPLQVDRLGPFSKNGNNLEVLIKIEQLQFYDDDQGMNRALHQVVFDHETGLIYTNPAYTPHGFEVLFEKAGYSYSHNAKNTQAQADWLMKLIPNIGQLIDIGCGKGDFLRACQANIKTGIEIDPKAIMEGMSRKTAFYDDIHFLNKPSEAVDWPNVIMPGVGPLVVTLWHTLEHFPDPVAVLRNLRQNTPPDTRLVIEVPVLEYAANEDIVGFFSPMHLTHFSVPSLNTMLFATGWDPLCFQPAINYNGYRVIAAQGITIPAAMCDEQKQRDYERAMAAVDNWVKNIERCKERIAKIPNTAKVIIWGAGLHFQYLERLTNLFMYHQDFCLVDIDPAKTGTFVHGIRVFQPDDIPHAVWQDPDVYVLVSSYGNQPEIVDAAKWKGVPDSRLITLYDNVQCY